MLISFPLLSFKRRLMSESALLKELRLLRGRVDRIEIIEVLRKFSNDLDNLAEDGHFDEVALRCYKLGRSIQVTRMRDLKC